MVGRLIQFLSGLHFLVSSRLIVAGPSWLAVISVAVSSSTAFSPGLCLLTLSLVIAIVGILPLTTATLSTRSLLITAVISILVVSVPRSLSLSVIVHIGWRNATFIDHSIDLTNPF